MKNRRERAKEVRRRKVAQLAAYCRQHTVKNCTIPKANPDHLQEIEVGDDIKILVNKNVGRNGNGKWKNPKEGYPQPKCLRKKYEKKYYNHDESIRKIVKRSSDYNAFPNHTFHPQGQQWFMEQVVQHKLAKWEKKNPRPVKKDQNPPDMFEQEFMAPWNVARENALKRIRDFVVSVYDKLHIVGNKVDKENHQMVGQKVTEVKDVNGKGHNVTYPNLKESDQLYKNATKAAQEAMDKNPAIVDCNLLNHAKDQKRPLLHAKRTNASNSPKVKNLKQHRKLHKAA